MNQLIWLKLTGFLLYDIILYLN